MIAQERGAIGVILYSDPKDTAPDQGEKYVKGRWLPDDGVQRGSILKTDYKDIGQGDPLTPGYPSKGDHLLKMPEDFRLSTYDTVKPNS